MSDTTIEPPQPLRSAASPQDIETLNTTRWAQWSIGFVILGLALRLALSSISLGTNDSYTWAKFGRLVDQHGLGEAYLQDRLLNHPTPPTLWAWGCYRIAGDDVPFFAFLMRLPAIAADVASCWLLWRIVGARLGKRAAFQSVAVMALSPVSILVSGYHCNTDSVYACLTLLAIYFAEHRRFGAGGLALAAALNVKILPVLMLPGFFVMCRKHRSLVRFGAAASLAVLPFLIPAFTTEFQSIRNVFGYGSAPACWGIPYLFLLLADHFPGYPVLEHIAWTYFEQFGKWVMLAGIGIGALWPRRDAMPDIVRLGALTGALFVVLAPGFAVQYLVFPVLLVLAYSPRWGLYATASAGLFAGFVYVMFLDRLSPLRSYFMTDFVPPAGYIGMLTWAVFLGFVSFSCRKRERSTTGAQISFGVT